MFMFYKYSYLCLIDISIFIGARSMVSSSSWSWNNKTMINDSNFQPSKKSACQQMTWPLTFTDGINMRPKQCEPGKSYFVCSFECKTTK